MRRIILCLFISATIVSFSAGRVSQTIGNFKNFKKEKNGITINTENANVQIIHYSDDVIRVRVITDKNNQDFSYAVIKSADGNFSDVKDEKDKLTLSTAKLKVVVYKKPLYLQFIDAKGNVLNEDDSKFGMSFLGTEVTCYKKLFENEKFIGLGEKTGNLNRAGSAYTNWNTDAPAYTVNQDPLYKTIPFYIGIHDNLSYGIFFDNTFKSTFNFGASNNRFSSFSAEDGEINYYFFGSGSVSDIVKDYTELTGKMKMPPIWSLGYQQCRWGYYPDKEFLSVGRTFREKNIPCDNLYLDIPYMNAYKVFTWHPEYFPKPEETMKQLKDMGFHVTVIVDPGIKVEKGYSVYEEGVKNNYFAKYPDGTEWTAMVWPGWCHFPDFTNSKTREWWGQNFAAYTNVGVEGFWNDMNEPASWGQCNPNNVEFSFEGRKGTLKEAHNIFGMQMARSTYEGAKKLMNKRPLVITRAAYSGVQRYSSVWTGDNVASDEHMLLAVRMVNSLGLSGIPFAGPDCGGFVGEPNQGLIQKWTAIGAFTPFYRNHTTINTKDQEPWSFGEETEAVCRHFINQRYRFLPYIYSTFYESTQSGLPVSRSLAMDFTYDENIYQPQYENQYLFGSELLIIPSVSTQNFCRAYLPKGQWHKLNNNFDEIESTYEGGISIIIPSSSRELPVFVKSSAIVPMQKIAQNTKEITSDTLDIHIYNGQISNSFVYYEDDGESYSYENGDFLKKNFEFIPNSRNIKVSKAEGSYTSRYKTLRFKLHGFKDANKKEFIVANDSSEKTILY